MYKKRNVNLLMNELKKYIFTMHYAMNYGAFLQTFALKMASENMNVANIGTTFRCDAYTLVGKNGKKYFPLLWRLISIARYVMNDKQRLFRGFEENKRLGLEGNLWCMTNKKRHAMLDGSIAICGSDQIWNPDFISGRENAYFADLAHFKKRVSYAASLGKKLWPEDFEKWALLKLKKFDAISVREESAVPYLTKLGLSNVVCVCDPTVLHDGNFYREHFKCSSSQKGKYSFAYMIREKIPESVECNLLQETRRLDLSSPEGMVSISQWLNLIDNAEFVVTDSFHCVVFCLLFHKKFVVIPNRKKVKGMNERFATILGKTGLESRCLCCDETPTEVYDVINKEVDWDFVDMKLDSWRQESRKWLNNAINS